MQDIITISHTQNNKPLHRVHAKFVLFEDRNSINDYKYHSGFMKDNIHYAQVIKIEPCKPEDVLRTKPNEVV